MDTSTNFSLTQLILVWTLLGFLLTWMFVFAVLALGGHSHATQMLEDVPAPSEPRPVISLLPKLHMATSSPLQSAETINNKSAVPSPIYRAPIFVYSHQDVQDEMFHSH